MRSKLLIFQIFFNFWLVYDSSIAFILQDAKNTLTHFKS